VPAAIVALHVVVVVFPVARAGVVRGVDVDAVDLALVGEQQQLQRVVVVGLDQDMVQLRRVTIADRMHRRQRRIDRLAHASHDHQFLDGEARAFAHFVRFAGFAFLSFAHGLTIRNLHDAPDFGQAASLLGNPLAALDACAVHRNHFGLMFLEHQAEARALLELGDLFGNGLPQLGIGNFGDLLFDAGHDFVLSLSGRCTAHTRP
jgi:hypothetical protein